MRPWVEKYTRPPAARFLASGPAAGHLVTKAPHALLERHLVELKRLADPYKAAEYRAVEYELAVRQ